jgi:hypothetical protein
MRARDQALVLAPVTALTRVRARKGAGEAGCAAKGVGSDQGGHLDDAQRRTREKVKSTSDDDEKELANLLTRSGQTYSYGWIKLETPKGRHFVSYDAVERIGLDP